MNCDAAWSDQNSVAGLRAAARDSNENIIGGVGGAVKSDFIALAEGLAVVEAIYLARSRRWKRVVLLTHSADVFQRVTEEKCSSWPLQPIADEIKAQRMFFPQFSVCQIRRSANYYADGLASCAKKGMWLPDWAVCPPFSVCS